jgi:hypothetical protein
MRHKIVTYLGLAAILLGLSASDVLGQGADRRGTAGATGTNVMFSNMQYFADIGVNTFGVAQRVGASNLAFTISSWDFGEIPRTTEVSPEITEFTFSPSFVQFGVSFARQLTDRIAAGATLKLLNEDIDLVSATGIAIDAGMSYNVGETGLRFGVALKNFGPQMSYSGDGLTQQVNLPGAPPNATTQAVSIEAEGFELPAVLNFGVSYTRELAQDVNVGLLGNYRSNSFAQDQFSGGLELDFRNLLYVRGSYELQEDMDQTAFDGWSMGAGVNFEFSGRAARFDYSYSSAEFFDAVQMFTVQVVL